MQPIIAFRRPRLYGAGRLGSQNQTVAIGVTKRAFFVPSPDEESLMAAQRGDSVYKLTEVIGTSAKSWEDAAKNAVETAAKTLRDLRIAEVVKMDMKVENGKVQAYRTRVLLSFKYESD